MRMVVSLAWMRTKNRGRSSQVSRRVWSWLREDVYDIWQHVDSEVSVSWCSKHHQIVVRKLKVGIFIIYATLKTPFYVYKMRMFIHIYVTVYKECDFISQHYAGGIKPQYFLHWLITCNPSIRQAPLITDYCSFPNKIIVFVNNINNFTGYARSVSTGLFSTGTGLFSTARYILADFGCLHSWFSITFIQAVFHCEHL